MRVSGLLHRGGLRVVPVGDIGKIAAQLFHQGDEFGDFLLGQQAHVQVQLGPLLRQLALAGLGNQDDDRGQQGAEPHEALEPNKRSGVEGCDGQAGGKDIEEHPPRDHEHNAIEKGRTT
jgi:hypothetical protein